MFRIGRLGRGDEQLLRLLAALIDWMDDNDIGDVWLGADNPRARRSIWRAASRSTTRRST